MYRNVSVISTNDVILGLYGGLREGAVGLILCSFALNTI